MTAMSSFSKLLCLSVILSAISVTCLSWAYFLHKWRGVVVSSAGDAAANGYYNWEPRLKTYIKAKVPVRGWRVPNVYDLMFRASLEYEATATAPGYFFHLSEDEEHWLLMRSGTFLYASKRGWLENTPPSTGWFVPVETLASNPAGLEPPPQVAISGTKAAPDPAEVEVIGATGSGSYEKSPALGVLSGLARAPGTALLLAINLAVAYHLWAKKVSSDTVVTSYALFWEEREYWRAFTSAFSHVGLLHLFFNMSSTWTLREVEQGLGTLQFLLMALNFVVTTGAVKILMKYALVNWSKVEAQRAQPVLGFSGVLFAFTTFSAVGMRKFCASGVCVDTWRRPHWGDYGDALFLDGALQIPYSLWPFFLLGVTHFIMPRASFIGHLSGIVVGYLAAWGLLPSPPVVAGASVLFMIQRSRAWARKMPSYSTLLEGWAGGETMRVGRARVMRAVVLAHACLVIAYSCLFTWGSGLAELMALVVGYNALQALKCCCWPDSETEEHRFCVSLAKAYGALSGIFLVGDLLSFGAILAQTDLVEWSGVSDASRRHGLFLLVAAAVVHGAAVAASIEAVVMFREGQTFLSTIGLRQVVVSYSLKTGASKATYCAGPTSTRSFPGEGRALGTRAVSLAV